MVSQQQAFQIAQNIIPDIQSRGVRFSDKLSSNNKLKKLPEDCWYISYSSSILNHLSCSNSKTIFLCISKMDGNILFHNHI